jgi:enterobactin synthetase component F
MAEESSASSRLRRFAREFPERPLLDVDERSYTYSEVDMAVDQLAQRLLDDLGEEPHRIVLRLAGTHEMVVAALAVERAGMTSVPLDPTAPSERVLNIIDQVTPAMVLSDVEGDDDLPLPGARPLRYTATPPADGVQCPQAGLAAVVFTSGSTGTPKGIMMPTAQRQGMIDDLERITGRSPDAPEEYRMGMIAAGTVGFSHAMVDCSIAMGATLCAYEVRRLGLAAFGQWAVDKRIVTIPLIPTVLRFILPTLPDDLVFHDLRTVFFSGETSTWEDVRALRKHLPDAAVAHNMLGQTEVRISEFAVGADLPPDASGPLPAGTITANRTVTIVDPDGVPVPTGTAGEIIVETAECALGYWGQPDVTASVFTDLEDGRRRVRTGDGGRLLGDGTLEHLGRLDHVVKVAGNRIDLGDIETALRGLDGVADAAATTFASPAGDLRLAGYAVPSPGVSLHPHVLRAAMARRLPGPMLPDFIAVLDALPQLPGGKVDRSQLPARAAEAAVPDDARQPSELEGQLCAIFAEVLGVEQVALDDDFFALGGDSIRAARLFAGMESALGIDRPVSLIVEAPTVSSLAAAVIQSEDTWDALVPLRAEGQRPPLFVVHEGRGDIFYATRLFDALGDDQPVLALQPKGLLGVPPEETSIEELAASYLRSIRRQRPHGPYLLYGYSMGGTIAFEMALQLRATGEEVAFLGIGDTPVADPEMLRLAQPYAARGGARLAQLKALPPGQATQLAGRLALRQLTSLPGRLKLHGTRWLVSRHRKVVLGVRRTHRLMQTGEAIPPELRCWYVTLHYGEMLARYVPSAAFDGPALLVRSKDKHPHEDLGWARWIDGELQIVNIGGDHGSIHDARHSGEVGRALRAAIDHGIAG